ncbi:MAG: DUF349 domain-containing protein [Kaistella sp.]|nr:DUF349 domain-containing protein [Kaistella sp.]
MITEDLHSDNDPKKNETAEAAEEIKTENQPDPETKNAVEIPEEGISTEPVSEATETPAEDVSEEKTDEIPTEKPAEELAQPEETIAAEPVSEEAETPAEEISEEKTAEIPAENAEESAGKPAGEPAQKVVANPTETSEEKIKSETPHHQHEETAVAQLTLSQTLKEMENIVNKDNSGTFFKQFNLLKDHANHLIHAEEAKEKQENAGNETSEAASEYVHRDSSKLSGLIHIFKEKQDEYHKKQDAEHQVNLATRQSIIDRLKNLYTNSEPGVNFFKEMRSIKEAWQNAGQVAKSEFKLLNNNYFHHLNQFYAMLEMNKEYREQEFAHNLEKRLHIIERAKELENEPLVQKALNELQYLHKLWKEEAEPVAEEFREKTWELFKEISDKIHERKSELSSQMEAEHTANLEKKNKIIEEIKQLAEHGKDVSHSYWQNAIKKIEELRSEFLKTGSVPRKLSNQNWDEFKHHLREFNNRKNDFYKNLKGSQQTNFEEKMKLIQLAKEHMHSEDWENTVPLFKKLQEDWKKIGHVPRSQTNKIWEDFREACNTFFNNFREKNNATTDNWKENFIRKNALLEELKTITDEEGSVEKIEQIKTAWNAIGKVPKEKLSINTDFNKTLREKLKLNKINEFDLKEEGLSETQITDKARKIKNQIADLEAEIAKLENNLGFFSNPSKENPLLKDTFQNIEDKKALLESLKQNLHHMIVGE